MSESRQKRDWKKTLRSLKRMLRHLFLHNGWLKLIAVVLSLVLWAGLISQDEKLTRDKNFQDVSVTVTGSETMKNNGYIIVSDLDAILSDIDIVAAVPQKQYENAEASAYNIRLDLSKINGTGFFTTLRNSRTRMVENTSLMASASLVSRVTKEPVEYLSMLAKEKRCIFS